MKTRNLNLSMLAITTMIVIVFLSSGCELFEEPVPENTRSYDFTVTRSNSALANATVSILTGYQDYSGTTDNNGRCQIKIPNDVSLPNYVIATVDHSSIRPGAVTVSGAANSSRDKVINCQNRPSAVLVKEAALHHLGNDQYGGAANSKHQIATEGLYITFRFELAGIPRTMPHLQLYARGIQRRTEIIINGIPTNYLGNSAPNGNLSSWDFELTANPGTVLKPGYNTLTIKTGASEGSDWDDIEFCALMLYYP